MSEQIFLSDSRTAVDRKYVGFTPNGGSIKPVHVAGGVLRSIYGKYNTTMLSGWHWFLMRKAWCRREMNSIPFITR